MNAKIAITSLVLAAGFAGSAIAETPLVVDQTIAGNRTVAEVQAEFAAYRKAGVNPWSISYNPLRSFKSATTRDAVVADYLASRDQVREFTGEDSGSHYLAQRGAQATDTLLAGQAR
jgi:hypothetical protein